MNDTIQFNGTEIKKGIPQGSPISAILSNIYMIDFDVKMKEFISKVNGKYYRYCDDILCIAPIVYKSKIEKFIIDNVDLLRLKINDDKTEI